MDKQVDKSHYNFQKYCFPERWFSYWQQLAEIFAVQPESVLEIGAGDQVVKNYLQNNSEIVYQSVDIAEDLSPDIIGSVDKLPLADDSWDVVCAFEVLEHLPFDKLLPALQEMRRVAKKYVIISLPHWGRHFSLAMAWPGKGRIRWQKKLNIFPIKHQFNGQHYWEIGKQDYPLKKITAVIQASGLKIKKDYVAFNSPYHHFFVLQK